MSPIHRHYPSFVRRVSSSGRFIFLFFVHSIVRSVCARAERMVVVEHWLYSCKRQIWMHIYTTTRCVRCVGRRHTSRHGVPADGGGGGGSAAAFAVMPTMHTRCIHLPFVRIEMNMGKCRYAQVAAVRETADSVRSGRCFCSCESDYHTLFGI